VVAQAHKCFHVYLGRQLTYSFYDLAPSGALNNSNDLTAWVDEVSGCLGLLINLVEHSVELRERMRAVAIPKGDGSDEEMQLVPLLSRLMSSAMTSGSG